MQTTADAHQLCYAVNYLCAVTVAGHGTAHTFLKMYSKNQYLMPVWQRESSSRSRLAEWKELSSQSGYGDESWFLGADRMHLAQSDLLCIVLNALSSLFLSR